MILLKIELDYPCHVMTVFGPFKNKIMGQVIANDGENNSRKKQGDFGLDIGLINFGNELVHLSTQTQLSLAYLIATEPESE